MLFQLFSSAKRIEYHHSLIVGQLRFIVCAVATLYYSLNISGFQD